MKEMRSIKRTPTGKYPRDRVRSLITAVHVLEMAPSGSWEVRTLGENGYTRIFDAKKPAIEHALSVKQGARVIVHQRDPRKVVQVRSYRKGDRINFKEVKFR